MANAASASNKRQRVQEEVPPPFFNKVRIRKGFGLLLIFTAVFLFISFISYFSTWKSDQVDGWSFSLKLLFDKEWAVSNKMGRMGAFLSVLFFDKLYGIASFFIIPPILVIGINLLLGERKFIIWKWLFHCVLLILLVSISAYFLLSNFLFPFGGNMGKIAYEWLSTLMGEWGLAILLIAVGFIYLWVSLGWKGRQWISSLFASSKSKDVENLEDGKIWESIIPEERELPLPHHKDDKFDILKENENKTTVYEEKLVDDEEESEPDMSPYLVKKNSKSNESIESSSDLDLDIVETPVEPIAEPAAPVGHISTLYDPKLDLVDYKLPNLSLLEDHGGDDIQINREELEENKNQIVKTLNNYGIEIDKIKATVGPTVTLYEIVPAPGVRISKIKNLEDDIALSLSALGIRIIAPIPGKGTIGIEVPNVKKNTVSMKSLLSSDKYVNGQMELPMALGKTISNEVYITDLAKMPHLLMAGATGQGKSVGLNAVIISLLYKLHPAELKFVMVDPKKVELNLYKLIENHFLAKLPGEEDAIITDNKKVINTLNALCIEMDQRYELLKQAQVRNLKEYNTKFKQRKLNPNNGHRFLPYIVLIVDEFADLMMTAGKEVETPIARLAQLARAIGIHLIIATQRPSVNIITGVIKANFPGRLAFKVASKIDSRTILDVGGADQLIGRGDLLLSINGDIVRLQCPFVDTPEVEAVAQFISEQKGYSEAYLLPEYIDPNDEVRGGEDLLLDKDELFDEAARIIVQHQQGSTSLIQRRLKLGYNRAGRLMDQLEAAGVVGPNVGSKAREVYFTDEYELERFLKSMEDN
jgi:S-DNA-T family DNA segregation ATPase FtsK/SpoIIIE